MLTPQSRLNAGAGLGVAVWLALQFAGSVDWSVGHVLVSVIPFAGVGMMGLSRPGWPFYNRSASQGAMLAVVSLPVLFLERKMHDEPAAVDPLWSDLPLLAAVTLLVLTVDARRRVPPAVAA